MRWAAWGGEGGGGGGQDDAQNKILDHTLPEINRGRIDSVTSEDIPALDIFRTVNLHLFCHGFGIYIQVAINHS